MPRPKQDDLGMSGPGVSLPRFKDIDRLADQLHDLLEERANLSTNISSTEGKILEKMKDKGLTSYKYRDQEVVYKPGIEHIKIKTVKAEPGLSSDESEEPPTQE